jgi:nitroreductase
MNLLKMVASIIRKILPRRMYRILRTGPMIVPSYHRTLCDDIERMIDIQYNSVEDQELAILRLRKDAHIIDKGLQRKDFKIGHSKQYYKQAKSSLSKIKNDTFLNDLSIQWSIRKIEEYEFRQHGKEYIHEQEEPFIGNYTDLIKIIKSRRSVRNYAPKAVNSDVIAQVLEPVNWASSSCNKQPIKVYVTNKPLLVSECLKQCKGATGFSDFVPSFMTFCADMRGYVLPSEIYLPMIDVSLGIQNSVLAAHTLGLSCTLLSWAQKNDTEEKLLRELLGIPEYYMIILNMTMGYPECFSPVPERKSLNNTYILK